MQNENSRTPCLICRTEILLLTSKTYAGLCKPCFDNCKTCTVCATRLTPRIASSHVGLCLSCSGMLAKSSLAEKQTLFHQARLSQIQNLLRFALESNENIDVWRRLIAGQLASTPEPPSLLNLPPSPESKFAPPTLQPYIDYPPEPQQDNKSDERFVRAYEKWAENTKRIEAENQRRYDNNVALTEEWNRHGKKREQEIESWQERRHRIDEENQKRTSEYAASLESWKVEKEELEKSITLLKKNYEFKTAEGVNHFNKLVLHLSCLPGEFPNDFDLEYNPDSGILILDHTLPSPELLSRVKEVKFVESRDELVEVFLSEQEFNQMYNDALYQTCLRRIHELFQADSVRAINLIVFNGWITSVDRATGNDTTACMLSVQAKKEEFQKINLSRVDPKACFKSLKGIGSSTLHSLTPIAPVLKINREDKRFVASYEVAGQLDERTNLAAMDWEDFEHLIREIFEKEFSTTGGEVKVTQASRDGGVDAVVFDPDPIRGGKTIIQAKRYTNTVGVAAVRELYGTVLNEGAMKGILVTTADYGPDAYEFAQGKPLVLLNGANLLHLLEKHGHKAKIDIKEAKRILGEKT